MSHEKKAAITPHKPGSFEAPGARLLVVDDNEINLDMFRALLRHTGMDIVTADSGRACLELVKRERFHTIFMDHIMPEMDGVEVLHEIQKLTQSPNEHTPVIALTANTFSGAGEFYLREGFAEFLTKPVNTELLEQVIVSYLPVELVKRMERGAGPEDVFRREEFVRLERKGFNISAGMKYCRGDSGLYEEMLVRFAGDAEKKAAALEAALQHEDMEGYRILAHALKSSSKMIGADGLSEAALAAEEARDMACIRGGHGALMGRCREAARHILDVFRPADGAETPPAGPEISGAELLAHLSELGKSLETFEADRAEAVLAEMGGAVYWGVPVRVLLREVSQDVEDFELSAAAEKVNQLIAALAP